MDKFIDIVKVIVIGIVEGISEWLPISSTGHMIILDKWFNISTKFGQEYWSFFLVVIQLGAILAVVVTFFKQLWPFSKSKTDEEKKSIYKTWINIVIGCLPAAILGLFLDDILDKYLYNYITVAITLIVYGVFFVLLEYIFKRKQVGFKVNDIYSLSMKSALIIGSVVAVFALIWFTFEQYVGIVHNPQADPEGVEWATIWNGQCWTFDFFLETLKVSSIVAGTLFCTIIVSKIIAAALPLGVAALKKDPAVVSQPLLTTIVDMASLLIYFAIAEVLVLQFL